MTDGVTIDVRGARELARTLKAAGDDLSDMTAANARVAGVIAAAAQRGAPRRTGRLAATVRPGATKTTAVVRSGSRAVPYAPPIHWGWGRRNIAANPWVSRAARQTEPVWTAIYAEATQQIVDKVKGVR